MDAVIFTSKPLHKVTSAVIDYATSFLNLPVWIKIHWEPSYEPLKNLKNQLKTNTHPLSSNILGGEHGNLGLVLTTEYYALFMKTSTNTQCI